MLGTTEVNIFKRAAVPDLKVSGSVTLISEFATDNNSI
jgi:hypothetical protein